MIEKYNLMAIEGHWGNGLGEDCIHYNGNGGAQAINLAYLWGYERMILLGFDMQATHKTHFFGHHPKDSPLYTPHNYNDWLGRFKGLASDLRAKGIEVINATRHTALTCFPLANLDDIL